MIEALSAEQLEALRRLDACTVADAIETFGLRLRNEGFTDGSVRCLFPHLKPTVGYAGTIKSAAPPRRPRAAPIPIGPIGGTTSCHCRRRV